jgi:phosphoribosylformylglycinamidine synthase PurS subunit
MECGRLFENEMMRIIVADEISPDSCRLWDIKSNDKLDKDRFRRDLGGLLEAYTEVATRLGILMENERPAGSGPVLVKSSRVATLKARVTVTLKSGILDPQGKAIEGALKSLGVDGVASVRQGKVFDIELAGSDKARAEAALKDAADKLLANTVIENYRVEVLG